MQKIKEKFKGHRIIYTILLIPVIGVFLFVVYLMVVFGIINYADRQSFDKEAERIAKIIPFSQRGLPVPKTDVPVTLPPDPGEAGKKTLAGIDSNNDGIRDDLEREIVYMYPQNEEVRRVLTAMVKKFQNILVTTGDKEHFKNLLDSAYAFQSCYEYLVFPTGTYDSTNESILENMVYNTRERNKVYTINQDKIQITFHTPDAGAFTPETCTQPLVKGQY